MSTEFHLSLGVDSLKDSVYFFNKVLNGEIEHEDVSGYINVNVRGCQLTLREVKNISVNLPEFHFGFNLSLTEFEIISKKIIKDHKECIKMMPKTVDQGTPLERKKMYLNSPSGYMIELKGIKDS